MDGGKCKEEGSYSNYRRRKTIEAIQIKKGEIVILARILTRVSSTVITTTLSSTVTHPE